MTNPLKTVCRKALGNKLAACLASLCLVVTMTPNSAVAQVEHAGETAAKKSVEMGTAAFERHGLVYYGSYKDDPIVWETLNNISNGAWEGIGSTSTYPSNPDVNPSQDVALMMSKYTLTNRAYNSAKQPISIWATSELRGWLNGEFLTGSFTADELNYLLATSKSVPKDEPSGGREMTADKVFVPDHNETKRYVYGLTGWTDYDQIEYVGNYAEDIGARKPATNKAGEPQQWWTRCNNSFKGPEWLLGYGDGSAMQVCQKDPQCWDNPVSSSIDAEQNDARIGVRPFFNLDMRKVLFTTPASLDNRVGALTRNTVREDNKTDETAVKMTMQDDTRTGFKVTTDAVTAQRGATTSLTYTGAKTGTNEYISAMVVDASDSNNVVYYGQLGAVSGANGTIEFTMPADIRTGSYKLLVFNEQVNGPKRTNFASLPTEGISFDVPKMDARASDFTFTPPENLAYDGRGKAATITPSDTNLDKINGVFDEDSIAVKYYDEANRELDYIPVNMGTYTVRVNVLGTSDNYKPRAGLYNLGWRFTIGPADSQTTLFADSTYVPYGGMVQLTAQVGMAQQRRYSPAMRAMRAPAADEVEFFVGEGDDVVSLGTTQVTYNDITKKDAGTAKLVVDTRDKQLRPGTNTITVRYGGSVDLGGSESPSIRVMVESRAVSLSWSGEQERTYDGKASEVTATAHGFENGDDVRVAVAGGTEANAGTHTATAQLEGDDAGYYKLAGNTTQSYVIAPKTVEATVQPIEAQTYTGRKIEPAVVALDGQTEIPASEYTAVHTNNQNVGQASITLKNNGGGNYVVSGSGTFDIKQAVPTERPDKKTTAMSHKGTPLAHADVIEGEMLGVDGSPLAGSFAWENESEIVASAGTHRMVFTPADSNYAIHTFDVEVGIYSPQVTDPDTGTDTGADTGTDPDTGTDTGADTGTDTGAGSGTDTGADTGTDAGSGTGADTGADDGEDDADTGVDAGSGTGAGTGTETADNDKDDPKTDVDGDGKADPDVGGDKDGDKKHDTGTPAGSRTTKVSGTLLIKVAAKGKDSQKLTWARVKGADGYDVWFAEYGRSGKAGKFKRVARLAASDARSYTRKALKQGRKYKWYVTAWCLDGGKRKTMCKSLTVSSVAGGNSSGGLANAKAVKVSSRKVTLQVGKAKSIGKVTVVMPRGKVARGSSGTSQVRYLSDNTKVVSVNKKTGKLKAKGKGTAKVYAIAANGVRASVKVTVK